MTDHDQLSIILDILGTPSIDDFYAITSSRSREYIRALPFRKKRPFGQLFPNASPLAIDFLERCLTFSPKRRIEVGEALKHPYLAPYHDPLDEPTAPPIDPSFFDFDNGGETSKEELKGMFSPFHLISSFPNIVGFRVNLRGNNAAIRTPIIIPPCHFV